MVDQTAGLVLVNVIMTGLENEVIKLFITNGLFITFTTRVQPQTWRNGDWLAIKSYNFYEE